MPIASRRTLLPRLPDRPPSSLTMFAWASLTLLLCWLWEPRAGFTLAFVLVAFLLAAAVGSVLERRRQRRLALVRSPASICTFARSFDCRRTETRIIRALYEHLQPEFAFALRAGDRLEGDLRFDDEDLEDILTAVAQRTGRLVEDTAGNPFYGCVRTVSDVVGFLCAQPLISPPQV